MATLTVNITALDADDRRAALFIINQENANRAAINMSNVYANQRALANIPPLPTIPDLPILPFSTAAEIKSSYEVCLAKLVVDDHARNVQQATEAAAASLANFQQVKSLFADATPAKRAAAIAALQ